MDVDVGRVVAGKYELVRLLGRGSMGEVWAAHHRTLGEQVALKLLTQDANPGGESELEDPATAAARFLFEAQVAARLSKRTRHIVRVTDHGEEEGLVYLVMELLDGETLESVLVRDGKLPPATTVTLVTQIARALAQAHGEGVLHRDLKPANVFLTRDEDGNLLVKLLDFGIARAIHAHRVTSAFSTAKGLVFGTPGYMSPEQAIASKKLDHRCDLWALATIGYEALTGDLPVAGEDTDTILQNVCAGRIIPIRQKAPHLPAALDAFFAKALADNVGSRYQSATELAQAFVLAMGTAGVAPAAPAIEAGPDSGGPVERAAVDATGGIETGATGLRRRVRTRIAVIAAALAAALVVVLAVFGLASRAPASTGTEGSAAAQRAVAPAVATATTTTTTGTPGTPGNPAPGLAAPGVTPVSSSVPVPLPSGPLAAPAIPVTALPHAHARPPATRGGGSRPSSSHAAPDGTPAPPPAPSQPKKVDKSEVL